MKITHIYHSGFVVELSDTVLIFDWYMGPLPCFNTSKKIVVFVTHGKPDHYSTRIWDLQKQYKLDIGEEEPEEDFDWDASGLLEDGEDTAFATTQGTAEESPASVTGGVTGFLDKEAVREEIYLDQMSKN